MEFPSCYPGWSAMAPSRLTATSASWVQAILLPQSHGFLPPGPRFTSSTTNVSVVVTAGHLSREMAEMDPLEIIWYLRFERAESEQQIREFEEKFIRQQAVICGLFKELHKRQSEGNKDIIDSVLRVEKQFIEEMLAEERRQAEELRYCENMVLSLAMRYTQLWEKLLKKRYVSHSLDQNIKMLHTPDDSHKSQGPDLREQLADGHQLAEHHVNRLSPGKEGTGPSDTQPQAYESLQTATPPQ
ncbi:Neuroblastoma breakpoint family member 11 [Plecturocebus cupreus]